MLKIKIGLILVLYEHSLTKLLNFCLKNLYFLLNKANLLIFKQQQIQNMTANASYQSKVVVMFRSILSLIISLPLPFIRLPIMPTFLSYLFRYYSQLSRFLCCNPILSLFISLSKSSHLRFTYSLFPLHDFLQPHITST